ncbi:MAG: hypothetical protein K9N51_02325 [Candidatus Pacebacteria bacterium]|nr:hypothetical protein [Candidatus Paceibacterota bacterium]
MDNLDDYELEERIAIMHYDGRVPLEMAERLAREEKEKNEKEEGKE